MRLKLILMKRKTFILFLILLVISFSQCVSHDKSDLLDSEIVDINLYLSNHSDVQVVCNITIKVDNELVLNKYMIPQVKYADWDSMTVKIKTGMRNFTFIEEDSNTRYTQMINIPQKMSIIIVYQNSSDISRPLFNIETDDWDIEIN